MYNGAVLSVMLRITNPPVPELFQASTLEIGKDQLLLFKRGRLKQVWGTLRTTKHVTCINYQTSLLI